jgi:hypothetical protein
MGSWKLPETVIKESLYYNQSEEASSSSSAATTSTDTNPEEDDEEEEEEEESGRETNLMGAIPIGEAIHGQLVSQWHRNLVLPVLLI